MLTPRFPAMLCVAVIALTAGVRGAAGDDTAAPAPVDPVTLAAWLENPALFTLVDARSPEEYAKAHVAGAINVPYDALAAHRSALPAAHDAPLVVYCRTGRRAGLLRDDLLAEGYTDVRVLDGDQILWGDDAGVFDLSPKQADGVAPPGNSP